MFYSTEIRSKAGGGENRLTTLLTNFWNSIKGKSQLPHITQFKSHELEDILDQCCIWSVERHAHDDDIKTYTYEYVGSSIKNALGKDLTGEKFTSSLQHFPAARIIDKINDVIANRTPVGDEGEFINAQEKKVKYRSCLLPFGTAEGIVTNILLGLSWSAFAEMSAVEW